MTMLIDRHDETVLFKLHRGLQSISFVARKSRADMFLEDATRRVVQRPEPANMTVLMHWKCWHFLQKHIHVAARNNLEMHLPPECCSQAALRHPDEDVIQTIKTAHCLTCVIPLFLVLTATRPRHHQFERIVRYKCTKLHLPTAVPIVRLWGEAGGLPIGLVDERGLSGTCSWERVHASVLSGWLVRSASRVSPSLRTLMILPCALVCMLRSARLSNECRVAFGITALMPVHRSTRV